jgi:hypothetical protein
MGADAGLLPHAYPGLLPAIESVVDEELAPPGERKPEVFDDESDDDEG